MKRFSIAALLLLLAGFPAAVDAEVPVGIYPECGTPDRPDLCPSDLGERWNFISYVRDEWADQVRPEELAMGSGSHFDRAWQRTTGWLERHLGASG